MCVCVSGRDYLGWSDPLLGRLPAILCDLPGGFGDEGGECEPIIVLILLEISKGDEEESVEFGDVLLRNDARPHLCTREYEYDDKSRTYLVCEVVEEGGLVGGFKVFDGVVVFEDAMDRDGQGGYAVCMVSSVDRVRYGRTSEHWQRHLRRERDCMAERRRCRFRDL